MGATPNGLAAEHNMFVKVLEGGGFTPRISVHHGPDSTTYAVMADFPLDWDYSPRD